MNATEHKALPCSANQTAPGAPGADTAHAGHTKMRPAANAAGRRLSIAIGYWGAAAKTPPNLRCGSTLTAFDEAAKTPLHEL